MRNLKKKRPEEQVRQQLIDFLVYERRFPLSLIVTEKKIKELVPLGRNCPINRRIDLLCYGKKENKMIPLLLVECKAGAIQPAHENQLKGYNDWVLAEYIALVSSSSVRFGHYCFEKEIYRFQDEIPTYDSLLSGYQIELN